MRAFQDELPVWQLVPVMIKINNFFLFPPKTGYGYKGPGIVQADMEMNLLYEPESVVEEQRLGSAVENTSPAASCQECIPDIDRAVFAVEPVKPGRPDHLAGAGFYYQKSRSGGDRAVEEFLEDRALKSVLFRVLLPYQWIGSYFIQALEI